MNKRNKRLFFVCTFGLVVGLGYVCAQPPLLGDEKKEIAVEDISSQKDENERVSFKQVMHLPEIPAAFKEFSENKIWEVSNFDVSWWLQDSNNDNYPDAALLIGAGDFKKKQEGIDANYDGFIDDFAVFDMNENLIYQEIDSNYDQKIDLWVEVSHNSRIKRIQRDLDYDGIVDRDLQY